MGNTFNTDLKIHQRFDLKGSWVKRESWKKGKKDLGLDVDFVKYHGKIDLNSKDLDLFNNIVKIDAEFLRDCGILVKKKNWFILYCIFFSYSNLFYFYF